jgi:predicted phosphodiesterase
MNVQPINGKIMVAGDWHGNIAWASNLLRNAAADLPDVNVVLQCGDFGYWEHTKDGQYYLEKLNENAGIRGKKIVWLDGNHENHDALGAYYTDHPKTDEGFIQMRENIFYSPRANKWEWDGKMFMTVGGAVSIDKAMRTPGKSWWLGETLSGRQFAKARAAGKIDYLFTHDAPSTYPAPLWKQDMESAEHRRLMDRIANATHPSMWFHGHYHNQVEYDYPAYDPFVRVYGLDCDGAIGNACVFDYIAGVVDRQRYPW